MKNPHYQAMVAAARKLVLPVRFQDDLFVHDKAFCNRRHPSLPFLWAIGEDGTHVMPLDESTRIAEIAKTVAAVIECFHGCKVFSWDGSTLTEQSPENAVSWAEETVRTARGSA